LNFELVSGLGSLVDNAEAKMIAVAMMRKKFFREPSQESITMLSSNEEDEIDAAISRKRITSNTGRTLLLSSRKRRIHRIAPATRKE
jgi:hypothetical protein